MRERCALRPRLARKFAVVFPVSAKSETGSQLTRPTAITKNGLPQKCRNPLFCLVSLGGCRQPASWGNKPP